MVESTARRERSEPKSAPLATYLWEVPEKPVAVRLSFDLIDRMEQEVIENFRSLTSRGSEIGGVLLGSVIPGSPLNVLVENYETIPCDYSRGPLYRLSDADLGRFERAIEQRSSAGGLVVTGYFRAHSRKGLSLDADDLAFLDARFRDAHHIALLVRPFATKTSVGGIFIREDGAFHGEASYLEFPFRSSQLTPSLWTPPEAAPPPAAPPSAAASAPSAAKPGFRPQVVPIGLRRDAGPATPAAEVKPPAPAPADRTERKPEIKTPVPPAKAAAPEMKPAAPSRPAAPEAKPAAKEVTPAAAATKEAPPVKEAEPVRAAKPATGILSGVPAAEEQSSRKIMMVLGGVAATVAALVLLFVYPGFLVHSHHTAVIESPAAELTLRVEPSGTDLLLTWNKNSAAIANATHGVLSINDGDKHENYDMDPTQLTTGSIIYTPVSGDVSFRMEVTDKNQTKTLTESVRSLRTRPSPMPDGKTPASASTTQAKTTQPPPQGATPAGAAPGSQPASGQPEAAPAEVPAVPAKAAPKVFNTASLTQRLRPASPTEIADANLGAAPTVPAGVNVNSSLSMPFASTPSPVAPAPPAAAAKKPAAAPGGKVAPAQLVYRREPEYPPAARQMHAAGQVVLEAVIGTDGRVKSVRVVSGHPLLVQAAKQAVMQWRYKPTLLDGQPVENTTQISLNFVAGH